ncbi:MAG: Ig-like domain-containing protein, partial [Neisseria sp.]|nr:Ig-like domain-containing protein [Neisseria sp.]
MSLRFNENTTGKTLQVRPQARLKFQAKPGEKYQLIDESTGKTPKDLEVTRQQNNLLLKSKSNDVEILIQDFWEACQPGDTQCFAIFDTAETVGGELVGQTIVTQEGPVLEALLAGEVGTLSESAILGVIGTSAAVISPVLGVVGGLVGLAAIGAAAGGGGGGSDGGSEPAKDTTPPKAPVIDKITNIDTNGDGKPDSTIITGKTEPSATVSIDIDGDGKPDATATADKDGNFELKVDQVLPSDKEYPVTSTDSNGNSSQPTQVKGDASDATAAVKAAEDAYATAKA